MKGNVVEFLGCCGAVAILVFYRWKTGQSYLSVDLTVSAIFLVLAYFYYFKLKGK